MSPLNKYKKRCRVADLKEFVKHELESYHKSIDELKNELTHQGYLEDDVNEAIYHATKSTSSAKQQQVVKNSRIFFIKEFFDRIGFGATSVQFLNIFLFQIGGGYFLIGLLNGVKTVLTTIFASIFHEYCKAKIVSKRFISNAGIVFGMSFIALSAAIAIHSVPLFVTAFLVGIIGVVAHGEPYTLLIQRNLKKERMSPMLANMGTLGVIIIAVAMVACAAIYDEFPLAGSMASTILFGQSITFPLYGFLFAFEITAILFIISGYLLSFIDEALPEGKAKLMDFTKEYYHKSKTYLGIFSRNSFTRLMLIASVLTTAVQVLGTSYYGIVIFQGFADRGAGPYMNVAVIFVISLVASIIGASLTPFISRKIGEAPMLVFGTLLIAMLPLAFIYNPNMYAVGLGATLSVLGSAMIGMAQGLFIRRILSVENTKMYFKSLSLASAIPLLIIIPLGSWLAQTYGPVFLFKVLVIVSIFVIMPLYFLIVIKTNKWSQKAIITEMAKSSKLTF